MGSDDEKPTRGRPRTLDADKTVDVAMQAYWEADPADVSINAICQRAGVSKPAVYRKFGSEDGLTLAVLDKYADQVLSEVFELLSAGRPLDETLDALITFASDDPRMEIGCVFYKMRAGKHRLGPKTRQRVGEIDAAAVAAYGDYLQSRRDTGDWTGTQVVDTAARFLSEQIALALTQRAAGEPKAQIRDMLKLAFSLFRRG